MCAVPKKRGAIHDVAVGDRWDESNTGISKPRKTISSANGATNRSRIIPKHTLGSCCILERRFENGSRTTLRAAWVYPIVSGAFRSFVVVTNPPFNTKFVRATCIFSNDATIGPRYSEQT
uniref:Uncharacterized protein n=1 Tax=Ditylum brightwellii TaxID=49249 RepID=A0A6U4A5Q6_9STRA|mmetsp:Transcript_7600/g.11146  ORF Transcript_7600/g.11146 Transcript_7600/m.11146 type:complete len:120 (-) Transcript_7600:436-795(-)